MYWVHKLYYGGVYTYGCGKMVTAKSATDDSTEPETLADRVGASPEVSHIQATVETEVTIPDEAEIPDPKRTVKDIAMEQVGRRLELTFSVSRSNVTVEEARHQPMSGETKYRAFVRVSQNQ